MPFKPLSRRMLFVTAGATAAAAGAGVGGAQVASARQDSYVNPLIEQRADPWIVKHTDGYYYFTGTVPEYDRIVMRRSTTLQGLQTAEEVTVWERPTSGEMGGFIWAPELHYIDGDWYVYVAAGHADNVWAVRPYVLENSSANPLEGTWDSKGRVVTHADSFSLDATTFTHDEVRYMCWAQSDPEADGGTSLYLSVMEDLWTLTGDIVRISQPTHDWEKIGHTVNEGAAVIHRNGRIFMTFSASATDANYAIGLLTCDEDADLLDPASWVKNPEPVFRSNAETSQYGPGHNSFTVTEDGREDVLVYHARQYEEIDGEPLYDPNRHTRIQTFDWNEDGTPNFGVPVADG